MEKRERRQGRRKNKHRWHRWHELLKRILASMPLMPAMPLVLLLLPPLPLLLGGVVGSGSNHRPLPVTSIPGTNTNLYTSVEQSTGNGEYDGHIPCDGFQRRSVWFGEIGE